MTTLEDIRHMRQAGRMPRRAYKTSIAMLGLNGLNDNQYDPVQLLLEQDVPAREMKSSLPVIERPPRRYLGQAPEASPLTLKSAAVLVGVAALGAWFIFFRKK